MKQARYAVIILAFCGLLLLYLISSWVDGTKRLNGCVCAVCETATPKPTAVMESEWGY